MKSLLWSLVLCVGAICQVPAQVHSTKLLFKSPKENLGTAINTSFTETKPVISSDGKTLYFCRQNYPKNIRGKQDDQDIYIATFEGQKWTAVRNMGWPLNDQHPNGVSSVSPDGNSLLLINEYIKGGYVKKGVSISYRSKNGWTYPSKIQIEDFYNFSPYVDYAMAANGKVLFMSVHRREGHGDQDIYVSLCENGIWGKPMNLGVTINTSGADFAPFLAADGKTLYFASEGHGGLGGREIFYAKRLDDTWNNWSKPINLGPSVNSNTWDAYYSLAAKGKYAYFVSKNLANNSRDIYRIELPQEVQPDPVVMVKGRVLDANNQQPLQAAITFHLTQGHQEQGIARSNPQDGSYKMVLPHGKAYQFLAKTPGFISLHQTIDLSGAKKYGEIQVDLQLIPLAEGEKIPIENIFFVRSKAELQQESFSELDKLVKLLKEYPQLEIELGGHTDNVGQPKLNLQLSWDRVDRVKDYLMQQGIASSRLQTKGYGDTRPIANNDRELNRRLNRRVEFTILGSSSKQASLLRR